MLNWLTFIAAAVAAVSSGVTAWRGWRTWSVDRRTSRFDEALARALSGDQRTARVGKTQLMGMAERGEMSEPDFGYVEDTIRALTNGPLSPEEEITVVLPPDEGDDGTQDAGGGDS